MRIPLDREGPPLYRQIETFLRGSITSGSLPVDTRLPASRRLASDLNVSRVTVENAYAELESAGLVYRTVGSGTFVARLQGLRPEGSGVNRLNWPLWQQDIAEREPSSTECAPPYDIAARTHPGLISLATGSGDVRPTLVQQIRKTIQEVIHRDGEAALEYAEPGGYPPLKKTIASVLTSQGLSVSPESIVVTSGSQQTIALTCLLLLKPGDTVVTESPTYATALHLFRALGLQVVGIPIDEGGMAVEKLEEVLQKHHPRLIYTMPNFQNPTGTCMGTERRRQLIGLSDRYNTPILEDDFVGDLRYEGQAEPALKALDNRGNVIYTSTFSKMLLPGLRIGFAVVDGPARKGLTNLKQMYDLGTSGLMQRVLESYITIGRYETYLRRSRASYQKRRDAMVRAIKDHLPTTVCHCTPAGGIFVWLRLPDGVPADQLLQISIEEGVSFAAGTACFADAALGNRYARLNFATATAEEINEGIRRLGKAIARILA